MRNYDVRPTLDDEIEALRRNGEWVTEYQCRGSSTKVIVTNAPKRIIDSLEKVKIWGNHESMVVDMGRAPVADSRDPFEKPPQFSDLITKRVSVIPKHEFDILAGELLINRIETAEMDIVRREDFQMSVEKAVAHLIYKRGPRVPKTLFGLYYTLAGRPRIAVLNHQDWAVWFSDKVTFFSRHANMHFESPGLTVDCKSLCPGVIAAPGV